MSALDAPARDLFGAVVGQEAAVAQLRAAARAPVHAYLFVGAPGTGTRAAARAFAAALLCADGGCGSCRDCRLAVTGEHPDLEEFAPEGAFINVEQARKIRQRAAMASVEGRRRVIVVEDMEVAQQAVGIFLKTIEEPREGVVFVLLAAFVPPTLTTIASRCCRIDFVAVDAAVLEAALVADGVAPERAATAAAAAGGLVERARLLATDDGVAGRAEAWAMVPARLDGTGAAVAVTVAELQGLIEDAAKPLRQRQAAELAAEQERLEQFGGRRSELKKIEGRHRRELRRHRLEELRAGLRILAGRYAGAVERALPGATDAVDALNAAAAALVRNPNEALLLQHLFLRLPQLSSD